MIPPAESPERPGWHPAFLAMLPTIRQYTKLAFGHLQGDNRDELIQETVVNACVAFERLIRRGRSDLAFPTVLARFAIEQVRAGRKVGTSLNVRDVLSRYAQKKKRFIVERLDRKDQENEGWKEVVIEDHRTPVLEQVSFRIDFPAWLSRLVPRNRRIAEALAVGHSTQEVARRFHLSPARISQLRRQLHQSWREFHGEGSRPRLASRQQRPGAVRRRVAVRAAG
jgi:hypothetical protein